MRDGESGPDRDQLQQETNRRLDAQRDDLVLQFADVVGRNPDKDPLAVLGALLTTTAVYFEQLSKNSTENQIKELHAEGLGSFFQAAVERGQVTRRRTQESN